MTDWSARWSARASWSARVVRPSEAACTVARPMTRSGPAVDSLLARRDAEAGEPVWAVKWRSADGTRCAAGSACDAWLVRDDGRALAAAERPAGAGHLTEYQARRRVVEFVEAEET